MEYMGWSVELGMTEPVPRHRDNSIFRVGQRLGSSGHRKNDELHELADAHATRHVVEHSDFDAVAVAGRD